ncbi:MAG: paraquat-inducible protein A [Saprospiraceae bacterium]|nr:paraquat-inducible protein A [Saprospiraceae bacterium]
MNGNRKMAAIPIYLASLVFFVLGLMYPIMQTEIAMGLLSSTDIYLTSSVTLLFEKNEYFLGVIILLFSIVFPILKYLVLATKIIGIKLPGSGILHILLEIINKWAMLDVFVVSLLILSLKMDGHSMILWSGLGIGTTYFAASIVGLLVTTFILSYKSKEQV